MPTVCHGARHGLCFSKSQPCWEGASRVSHTPTMSVLSSTLTWSLAFHFLGIPDSLCSKTFHTNEVVESWGHNRQGPQKLGNNLPGVKEGRVIT